MRYILFVLFGITIISSCRKYSLTVKDRNWQPYELDDVAVFLSSQNEVDTIRISDIHTSFAENDPLSLFPDYYQTQYVNADRNLFSIGAGKNKARVLFNLKLGEIYKRHPTMYMDFSDINIKVNIDSFDQFTDYAKIEAIETADNMKNQPFDLRYIYWNDDYGYLGLEYKDGYMWTLQSFIRDGKDLLE